jgi:hypothetical protein
MPTNNIPLITQQDDALNEHAIAIRDLCKRSIDNAFEIGRHLTEANKIIDHGCWLAWLRHEFDWSESTARRLMQIYELGKSVKLTDLKLPLSTLYLLTAPSTPEKARDEVLARARARDQGGHRRA